MAEIKQPTVDDCGEPEVPKGPYVTYCAYEYIAFYNCRGAGGAQSDQSTINPLGSVATYTSGGNGTSTGNVGLRNITGTYNGNPISLLFMGVLSSGWTDYFIDPNQAGQGLVGKWFAVPQHNFLSNRSHIKMAKYIHLEMHVLSQEDLYGEGNDAIEGNEIWECPAQPQFQTVISSDGNSITDGMPASPNANDFGQDVCPKYYKLSSCTDCSGNTDTELEDKIFEIIDRKSPTVNNKPIIEYPENSNDCYEWTAILPNNEKDILTATQETGFSSHNDCDECRRDYWVVVISPVKAPETWLPVSAQWLPQFAVSNRLDGRLDGQTAQNIAQGVAQGMMAFRRMSKSDILNQVFVNANGPEFVYQASNGVCYRALILDASKCMDSLITEWTYYTGNTRASSPHYVHSTAFTTSQGLYKGNDAVCDCEKDAGDIGRNESLRCKMVDGPGPVIDVDITPPRVLIEVDSNTEGVTPQSLTFTIQATGNNLTYKWYRVSNAGSQQIGGNSPTVTFSRAYSTSENHDGVSVFNYVYCEVSNNNGATTATSSNAIINVSKIPIKLYPDGTKVRIANVEIYCLSQTQAKQMRRQGFFGGNKIHTPSGAGLKSLGVVQQRYIKPEHYDGKTNADFLNKWYIQGGDSLCSKRYTIYKIKSIRTINWENLSPDPHKGQKNPNDDELDLPEFQIPSTGYTDAEWELISNDPATLLNIL